jgi:hypothetical protein
MAAYRLITFFTLFMLCLILTTSAQDSIKDRRDKTGVDGGIIPTDDWERRDKTWVNGGITATDD